MNQNKYKYILVDTTNLFFKCYNSIISGYEIPPEKIGPEETCQVINLMLELTEYLKREFCYIESEIYFLFDNSQSKINIRKLIDESYKSERDKKFIPKNIYSILKMYSNILKVYSDNYRIVFSENLEADDLVKPLIEFIKPDLEKNVLLVSDDMDWSRCIGDFVHWYNWKNEIIDKDNFYRKYEFFPTIERICIYKSFIGDYSDSIKPAVSSKFDRKVLIEILNKYDSLQQIISDAHRYVFDIKTCNEIIQNSKELKRNYQLVYFIELKMDIKERIYYAKKNENQVRIILDSLNIIVPEEFQTKEEIEDNFFSF